MKIGELFVQLGVKADTFTVRDFSSAVGKIPLVAFAAITSLAGLSLGFLELTKNTVGMANSFALFKAKTGLSVTELQKWQSVARQVGLTGSVVQGTVEAISMAMASFRTGSPNTAFLAALGKLGVDTAGKNAFEILDEMIERSQGKRPADISKLLGEAGLDSSMARIFELGGERIRVMMKDAVILSPSDIQALTDFQIELANFGLIIKQEFAPVLRELAPHMGNLAKALGGVVKFLGKGSAGTLGNIGRLKSQIQSGDLEDLIPFLFRTLENILGNIGAGAVKGVTNVTQNIYSTAPPEEVARIAEENLTRQMVKATKHFNNGVG